MGSSFGGGLTNDVVTQGGKNAFVGSPQDAQAYAMKNTPSAIQQTPDITPPLTPGGQNVEVPGSSIATGLNKVDPSDVPQVNEPSFRQAANDPITGLPNAASPLLTKGGKLLTLLTSGLKGALAGAGSLSAGAGAAQAQHMLEEPAVFRQQMQHGNLENQLAQAQVQNLPWQRAALQANLGKTQAETAHLGSQITAEQAKATLDEAQANAAKFKESGGVMYDVSGKEPVPATNVAGAFVPLDASSAAIAGLQEGQKVPVDTAKKLKEMVDAGLTTVTANGRVQLVDKSKGGKVIKDLGKSTPLMTAQISNPFFGMQQGNPSAPPDATGEDVLKGMSPLQKTLIKGVANYDIDPNSARARGMPSAILIGMAKQYDPGYNEQQYGERSKIRSAFKTGEQGKTINSLNTATGHIAQLDNAVDALNNSDFPALNKVANDLGFQVGSDRVTNFNTIKNAVAGEVSKVFKGGQATDAEIQHAESTLSSANTPDQLHSSIKELVHLMGSKLNALDFQYKNAMGKPSDFNITSPESNAVFQKYGVQAPTTGNNVVVNPTQGSGKIEQYKKAIPGIVFPGQK